MKDGYADLQRNLCKLRLIKYELDINVLFL